MLIRVSECAHRTTDRNAGSQQVATAVGRSEHGTVHPVFAFVRSKTNPAYLEVDETYNWQQHK